MERHDHDAAKAEIQPSVSQTQRSQPLNRLQKRAPAKMQLKKLSLDSMELYFRSPIPLLSPVVLSLSGTRDLDRLFFTEEAGKQNPEESVVNDVIPTNGWQHHYPKEE
jgi:hypothetical protein